MTDAKERTERGDAQSVVTPKSCCPTLTGRSLSVQTASLPSPVSSAPTDPFVTLRVWAEAQILF